MSAAADPLHTRETALHRGMPARIWPEKQRPTGLLLHVAPATSHSSTSEGTFTVAVQEQGSPKPESQVTPQTPVITPKSDNEELVPGHSLGMEASSDRCWKRSKDDSL